jgi:hypothetical protein
VIRVSTPDRDLQTTRSRLAAFRPECECGWRGHSTRNMAEARAEMRWHRHTFHQDRQ